MSDLDQELAARGSTSSRTSKLTLALVVALVAVAAFGGGVFFQRSTGAATTTTTAAGGPPAAGRQAPGDGGGFVSGEVTKVSGSTLTITQPDGSSVQVTTNGETKVTVSSDGALSDLKAGDTVVVQGEQGSNGDLTASSVTEGMLGGGFRNGGPRPTRTP